MVTVVLRLNAFIRGKTYVFCLDCLKCNTQYRRVKTRAVCWSRHLSLLFQMFKSTTHTRHIVQTQDAVKVQ